jgi:hypothetical protein
MSTPVNMGSQVVTPTVESVRAACARARQFIEAHHLGLDATIGDYPIGRRERGQCRLQVEYDKRKGYRTVRTTTDKCGRWCKPHKGTFRNDITVVVDDLEGERTTGWLAIGERRVYVQYPNGEGFHLVDAPCLSPPRRTEEKTVMVMTPLFGSPGQEERMEHVWPADPPEVCDAWDAWVEHRDQLRLLLARVWDRCSVQA